MKKKKQIKWISYGLLMAFVNLQVSPVWANTAAVPKSELPSDESEGKNNKGDPVNTKNGNNFFTEVDFSFNTPGVPLSFSRQYNSIQDYDGPVGAGWSHSLDWRLHEAVEVICKITPPVPNESFTVDLWEGTTISSSGIAADEVLTVIPTFLFGAPTKPPTEAYVQQPSGPYYIGLHETPTGPIGTALPSPIVELPTTGVTYTENRWMEVYEASGNTTRFWDNDGDGIWLAKDNNLKITLVDGEWILHLPGGIQRKFDTDGRMVRHQDGWGKGWTFAYDTNGYLDTATHDNAFVVDFGHDQNTGHLTGITAGSELTFVYNYLGGQLDEIIRTVGTGTATKIREYEYTDGILVQKINPANHIYHFGYEMDDADHLTHKATSGHVDEGDTPELEERWLDQSLVYRSGTWTDFTSLNPKRSISQLEEMAYSSQTGKLIDNFGPGLTSTDARLRGIHYGYNAAGDTTEEKIFDGSQYFSTHTTYDNRHNPETVSVAYNTTTPTLLATTIWNPTWMLPASIADAEGDKTGMTYENGSLKTLKRFYGTTTSYDTTYNYYDDGLLENVVNANQNITDYTYYSNTGNLHKDGYLKKVIPDAGPQISMDYDINGYLKSLEILTEGTGASTGRTTTYDYNALGWLDKVTYADSRTTQHKYNGLGYLTNTVDRAGRITDYAYAPTKKLTSVKRYIDPDGDNIEMEIAYDYDNWFNTVTITEPMGRSVESYQLDVQDRIEEATNVEGQTMDITYFVGDFVNTITRFDNSTIANTYDAAGRKDTTTYSPRSPNTVPVVVDNDYYADGQLKSATDTATTVEMGYNKLNQLKAVTNTIASASSVTSVAGYLYDPVGNLERTAITIGTANPLETIYQYDDAERIYRIYPAGISSVFTYSYKPENGRVDEITSSATGITTTYTYDLMDRVKSIVYDKNNTLMRTLAYTYYEETSMIKDKTITGNGPTRKHAYVYDSLDRLTDEDIFVNNTKVSDVTYNYDLAGNRTTVVDNQNSVTTSYALVPAPSGGNRLASWGSGFASYDTAGNTDILRSQDGSVNLDLDWDERYRLTSATSIAPSAASVVNYSYDVQGRKISRTKGGVTEYYIYDGNQIVADVDATGKLLRTYSYGPGIDNILTMTVYGEYSTDTYYYVKDHQNTVIGLANSTGWLMESYEYDAYGRILDVKDSSGNSIASQQSALGNRYTFQGREIDWDTGLMYFRARWYNPETGRWLSKDPIGIAGGLNLYVFCSNNPVMYVDPFGLCDDRTMAEIYADRLANYLAGTVGGLLGGASLFGGGVISGIGDAISGGGSLAEGANPGAGGLPDAIGSGMTDFGDNIMEGANNLLEAAGGAFRDGWNDEPFLF